MKERKKEKKRERKKGKERKKERKRKGGQEGEGRTSYTDEYRTKNKCVKIVLLFLNLFNF